MGVGREKKLAISVAILEDDSTLSQAMVAYFEKKGISARATASPDETRHLLKEDRIKLLIVDCLLPGESGVDFVQSIRKLYPAPVLDVILMSGIFVEPNFIKESVRSTQAVTFLAKPFQLDSLEAHLTQLGVVADRTNPRRTLYQSFSTPANALRERQKIVEALEDVHGYDLPFIYNFLQYSRVSGHLNVTDSKGRAFGITYAKGFIVGVDFADTDTKLGKLLIESGFILPEDLEYIMKEQSGKKIGERLIEAQLLSPHGFEQVLANQMSLRLSRTISADHVKVNFVPSEVELTKPNIAPDVFLRFMHDWIASKVSEDWLIAHFTPWGDSLLAKGPEFQVDHPAMTMPLLTSLENWADRILTESSINDLFEQRLYPQETLVKALHFLVSCGIVILQERPVVRSFEDQQRHLRNVQHQFAGKNPVEIFDLMVRMTTASEQNPSQVYSEFVLMLGKSPTDRGLAAMYADVRRMAEGAFEAVKSGSHLKLKDELAKQEIERKLKASSLFEQARNQLEKAQYGQALSLLERIEKLDPKFAKLHLFYVWARLGHQDHATNREKLFKVIDKHLLLVEPEDKFDAIYAFVTGLYQKVKGETNQAKKSFERAIGMDNTFIPARRELTLIQAANKPKQDVFNQDLKTLVGNLFRSKK